MSPTPPLMSSPIATTSGSLLIILSWALFTTLLSYVKTIVTVKISEYNGDIGLFWVGFQTQVGACVGATIIFALINYTDWFSEDECV